MRIALATAAAVPPEFDDDQLLAEELRARGAEAEFALWDGGVDWPAFDLVVIRSTWDYTRRLDDFLAWAETVGDRLRNPPEVVRWNSDKRYLADVAGAGLAVVPTTYIGPGDDTLDLPDEVIVKPTISAGARDTGRFGREHHDRARALLARLAAAGRTAMVQPYLASVDAHGETAVVFVAGAPTHVLRKRPVLRPDEEAPTRADALGAAEAMYDPELVSSGSAGRAEHELAGAVIEHLGDRFGAPPLYARVDMVRGADGEPLVLELELVEPCLYLRTAPPAAAALAEAIVGGRGHGP